MESEPTRKKIVIRREQPAVTQAPPAPETTAAHRLDFQGAADEPPPEEELHPVDEGEAFQGEYFDQYFRPIGSGEASSSLAEIATEPLAFPMPDPLLAEEERELKEKGEQHAAEALSHQIYKLAQTMRETRLQYYLSAFQVVLADYDLWEARRIREKANSFFNVHYYDLIQERGERPEILAQLLKRVGHDTRHRLRRVVDGLDVKTVARELWNIQYDPKPDKRARLLKILDECTPNEVRALRVEYCRIPLRDLSAELEKALTTAVKNRPLTPDDPEYWLRSAREATEATARQQALQRFLFEQVAYILRSRDAREVEALKTAYDNLRGGSEPPYRAGRMAEDIQKAFQHNSGELLALLDGFSIERAVEQIHLALHPELVPVTDASKLDKPEETDGERKIAPRYVNKLKKRRPYREDNALAERVRDYREQVLTIVESLSWEQFCDVNAGLLAKHGYQLDPSEFPSLYAFDARAKALEIIEALKTRDRASRILRAMSYLPPLGCQLVASAFNAITGSVLSEAVLARLHHAYHGKIPDEVRDAVQLRCSGRLRSPLHVDLLERFGPRLAKSGGRYGPWDLDIQQDAHAEEEALKLAEILNDPDGSPQSRGEQVVQFLSEQSYDDVNAIEHSFFHLSDPTEPLLLVIDGLLSAEFVTETSLVLAGYRIRETVQSIVTDLGNLLELKYAIPDAIRFAGYLYQLAAGRTLTAAVHADYQKLGDQTRYLELLSVLAVAESSTFHQLLPKLADPKAADPKTGVRERVGGFLRRPWIEARAFERASDSRYGKLRFNLKALASVQHISDHELVEAIMHLEGLPPEVPQKIVELYKIEDLHAILEVLGKHRVDQPVIEESCDVLLDESFRRALTQLGLDPDIVNRVLLHLDSFYPFDVADHIYALTQKLRGDELAQNLAAVLEANNEENVNPEMPSDPNWIDEMRHQVRIALEERYGLRFMDLLRSRGLEGEQLVVVAERSFGEEPTSMALRIRGLVEKPDSTEIRTDVLLDDLTRRGTRSRERVRQVYEELFALDPAKPLFADHVRETLKGQPYHEELVELFFPKPKLLENPPEGETKIETSESAPSDDDVVDFDL